VTHPFTLARPSCEPRDAQVVYLVLESATALLQAIVWTTAAVYFISHTHLGPLQLVLLGTAMELSILVFEIPTGIVADAVSRRRSVLIGTTLIGVAFVLTGLLPSFPALLGAQALLGLGYTFTSGATVDRETAAETWWRFDINVRNPLTGYRFLLSGGPRGYRWLNGTGVHSHDVTDAGDFRLSAAPPPPAWARDAVFYQIFPDRFARSARADGRPLPTWARPAAWGDPVVPPGDGGRQLYGGDLDGITERLDHLAALGVNALYLTPFFPGASNHRYNAASFEEVDPLLGGDKALARLSQEVHARGWHLLGDLTTNHCGDTHPWFRRALRTPVPRSGSSSTSPAPRTTPTRAGWGTPACRNSASPRLSCAAGCWKAPARSPGAGCGHRSTWTAGGSTWPT
jgi:hypothetical protein